MLYLEVDIISYIFVTEGCHIIEAQGISKSKWLRSAHTKKIMCKSTIKVAL